MDLKEDLNCIGSSFKSITGTLDYTDSINKINWDENKLPNLMKNQILVTTLFKQLQIDKATFTQDLVGIQNTLYIFETFNCYEFIGKVRL